MDRSISDAFTVRHVILQLHITLAQPTQSRIIIELVSWLSWLERTVHIREVTGSSPVETTVKGQASNLPFPFFTCLA